MTNGCDRPGCAGHYAADGYCDECGHKHLTAETTSAAGRGTRRTAATQAGVVLEVTAAATPPTQSRRGSGRTRAGITRTGGRGRLGADLVAVPPVPRRDPATAVLADPSVPESQRFCPTCGGPV